MNEISPQELERLLASLGTGDGLKLKPCLEEMAPAIAPDLQRILQDESFREYLWQSYGKAKEGQKPQVEIMGRISDNFPPITRDSFLMSLQSWASALLMPLPQSREEPLLSLLQEFHVARRRELLSTNVDSRTGAMVKREPSEKQKRWWGFLEACERGDLAKVQEAVENGVLKENREGASGGLFSALVGGGTEAQRAVAGYLLENGADIETEANANKGTGLLHSACYEGNLETVKFLLDHGAKVDGNKLVLKDDVDGDDPNYCGLDETPFIAAAMGDHLAVMEVLIAAGANAHAWCDSHGSALDCTRAPEVIEFLEAHGVTYHYGNES